MSKFENIKTTATAAIITIDGKGDPTTEFKEVEIPYTRTNDKAVGFVREALQLDENAMVAIQAIKHEKLAPKQYNLGKVFDNAHEIVTEKPEKLDDGFIAISRTIYTYSAFVYGVMTGNDNYENTEQPFATVFTCESPNAYTKGNARDYIAMRFEESFNDDAYKVLWVYKNTRTEGKTEWAIIHAKKAAKFEL